ncbi:MAG: PspC domain-containing protein [Anaerolineae bacterium]|nr:PspC domain-containing protein [Anaerolineae bacterium]
MERHFYRSRRDRIIAGVAGGIGEYFGFDPLIARVLLIVLALASGWGILLYIVLMLVMPEAPLEPGAPPSYRKLDARERSLLLGAALVVLGLALLARELGLWWWIGLRRLWPLLLVAAGVAVLVDQLRRG